MTRPVDAKMIAQMAAIVERNGGAYLKDKGWTIKPVTYNIYIGPSGNIFTDGMSVAKFLAQTGHEKEMLTRSGANAAQTKDGELSTTGAQFAMNAMVAAQDAREAAQNAREVGAATQDARDAQAVQEAKNTQADTAERRSARKALKRQAPQDAKYTKAALKALYPNTTKACRAIMRKAAEAAGGTRGSDYTGCKVGRRAARKALKRQAQAAQ